MAIVNRDQALARQLGQQRNGQGSLYGGPPPPPAPAPRMKPLTGSGMSTEDLLTRNWEGGQGGGGDSSIGGAIMGGLGTVLGGAAKGLDFVSNLGTLAFEEVAEGIMGREFGTQMENGKLVDQRSNWDKLTDANYGMGELLGDVTGNKWIDRAIGFVGDVALDPISYIGGAAMKSNMVMGKLGREGMVKQAARLGMSDDVAKHVAKFGHVGLDDVTREALGVKKAGVYWGWGDKSVYLPGTNRIGKVAEKGFSTVRLNSAGRLVGKVGKGRGEESLAVIRRVAQTGKTIDGISPKAAGITLEMIDKFNGVAGMAAEPYARLAQKQFQGIDDLTRTKITKEIESLNIGWDMKTMGANADPAKLAKLSPEAQSVIALRDLVYSNVREATGEALDMGFRGPGYLPHRSTKEAWDFFGDDSATRTMLNGGNVEAGQDAALTRSFTAGKTVDIKGRKVTFDDASIEDINAKLTEAFPEAGGIKFVEDNAVVLMERYIGEMSRVQGHHAMLMHALDMGELGSVKHMSTEMVLGAQNLTKNKQVADFLQKELISRYDHETYLLGEAARVGKEISKALDGSLVRMVDEAAEEHKELVGLTKTIKQQLTAHNKGRKGAEKAIRDSFTAERTRLSKQVDDLVAVKAELDNNIAVTKQAIADGYTQETAQVRKALDTWIKKSNAHAEKIGMDTQAIEGLTTLDEMYGFVMAQTGRMEEVSSSPQLLMEFFADLQGTKILTGKEKLFEEVPLDRWAMDAATENQAKLDILMRDGTFSGWDQALDDLGENAVHPYLNQGRPEITSRLNQSQLNTVDDAIESQQKHIWKQRGDWEDTVEKTIKLNAQQTQDLKGLNGRAIAARDKTQKTLQSNRSNAEVNKGTLANAVKNLRIASDAPLEEILKSINLDGSLKGMKYADRIAFQATTAERVAIAREKLLVQYLEMENRTMYMVAEHMNAPTLADDFGGLSDEVFKTFEYMKEVRSNLNYVDDWLTSNGAMGTSEWINLTALGSDAHRLRQKRWVIADTQEQLHRHTSKDVINDSRTLVDQSKLDDSMEFARQRNMEVQVGDRTATLGSRNQSVLPYDAEASQIARTPSPAGFYGPQRPAPVFPEKHAPGNMANARVMDRRVLAENVAFLESLHKKRGVYKKVQTFVDDDGATQVRYGTTETEVPVFANPKTVEELDVEIAELTAVIRGHQNIIDDLANIPTTSQMDPNNIDREVLKVMRIFLDGVNDSVEGAKKAAKKLQNTRREQFPQVDTPSHNPNRWQKGKPGRPDNAPDPVKHPTFAGDYDSWSKIAQDAYDYNNDMLRIAHKEGQPWHELATENRSVRQVMDDWFELGREPNSTKYMPDAPFGQTWKQTPPWSRKGDIDMNANVLDGGEVKLTDKGITGGEHLTSSIGEQLRYSARNTVGGEDARHLPGSSDDAQELLGMGLRSADERYGDELGDDFLEQIGAGGSRNPGIDLATQERYEREAARSAEKVRDDIYAQLGMDNDMVQQAHGQGVANQRDVLLWTKIDESSDYQAKFVTDGEPITPRQLQHRVAEKYGYDFDAYKADHPNTRARDFYTPDGKKSGGISYKEAGEVLGGEAKKFRHGSKTFQKVMGRSGSYEREMSYLKAQDILERMTPEARTSLYDYAKQIATYERKLNIVDRDVAQKQLDELVGFRGGQAKLGEQMDRSVGYGQRAQTKFEDDLANIQASSPLPAMTDDLARLEAAVAPMADDGEFGLNKLAAVENALGKREAEQISELDGVRAAIEAEQKDATEHAKWAKDRLERIRAIKKKKGTKADNQKWDESVPKTDLDKRRDEFENILNLSRAEPHDEHAMKITAHLMENYNNQLKGIDDFAEESKRFSSLYQKAVAGSKDGGEGFNLDMQRAFLDGYERLNSKMFPGMSDMAIDSTVKKNVENWMSAMSDDLNLKWFDEATQVFKSYATMTPGFHLRNFMGATFMNFSDGVKVKDVRAATRHWRGYVNDPENYIKSLGPEDQYVKDAFEAVFAVGAGGSFDPGEIGTGAVKAWKGLKNNKATRMSRRYGEDLVEGPVRLAAALNTTSNGGGMSMAASRVKRLHFNYADLSSLDQKMKRVIPFFMFMSRNLPLQIEQMWRRPKAYAIYNHFMNNFDESDENTLMPKYLKDAGAIVMGGSWFGDESKDFVFAPDLQHSNLMQDIMAFSGQGEQGIPIVDGLLASGNPIVTKPMEIAFNHSGFRGGDAFFDKKQDKYGNWVDKSGQEKALERIMYGIEGVLTPTGTAKGLLGINPLGSEDSNARLEDRQLQKSLNYIGFPFKQLGDYERDYERRRRGREG